MIKISTAILRFPVGRIQRFWFQVAESLTIRPISTAPVLPLINKSNLPCCWVEFSNCIPTTSLQTSYSPLPPVVSRLAAAVRMADARYCVEYAKTSRSSCKKCKQPIVKGGGRIGKITTNPFSDDGGEMKQWYHLRCMFETLKRARATTKKIETPADLEGFPEMDDAEKDEIKQLIKEFVVDKPAGGASKSPAKTKKTAAAKQSVLGLAGGASPSKKTPAGARATSTVATGGDSPTDAPDLASPSKDDGGSASASDLSNRDNSFRQFRRLCEDLETEPSYNAKTKLVANYLKFGNSGDGFTGDVYLLVKLLLPTAGKKRVYNLQSKQIVKLLSQIFGCNLDDLVEDLEKGDVAETAKTFFLQSSLTLPAKTSTLTLAEVDRFLDRLTTVTKEDDQRVEMAKVVRRCTANDLKYVVRLIKHDLRINAGAKHVLDALDPNAYAAFQASNDLRDVVDRVLSQRSGEGGGATPGLKKALSIRASLMTPVKPMLAEACRSVAMAMKKCPNGMYAEIKYDGERVQVHKKGDRFEFFSRSLKAVQPHKVEQIKDYIPKACPHGDSMILDSEVLLVDNETGAPLPFGTLGIHKKSAFKDATCCLFIFDIIYFNGETLMDRPICERRKLLEENIKEVKNHIMISEQSLIKREGDLSDLIMKVIRQGLEGLVLKDLKSVYEPGKRHWLKVKKDYLAGGAMADTADLIVLGAYYGTGNKGGMMSVFLMGVHDKARDRFRTVAKCGNGHDDATIARLQKELDVTKISKDPSKVPAWLLVNKTLIPDFVVKDPKAAPIWEITGAEFSHSSTHTADGISIRFPRVTRIRDDKDWTNATDLERLKVLYKTSKETTDIPGLVPAKKDGGEGEEENGDDDDGGDMDVEVHAPAASATGTKRKRAAASTDQSDESPGKSPAKRRKPVCKYGPKCYQKSRAHKEQFDHPWDSLETHSVKCAGIKVEKPLLDMFTGVKLYIVPGTARTQEIRRYFIAYDGEVLEDYQKSLATFFIADGSSGAVEPAPGSSTKCLKAEWVWDSLEKKEQQPIEKYLM